MHEIEEKFVLWQVELIEEFKKKMHRASEEVLGRIYTDVAQYALADANVNYLNFLRDELRDALTNEIATKHGQYSWAHSIRMILLSQHKEELQNKIIEDLLAKIQSQDEHIKQMQERRYYL